MCSGVNKVLERLKPNTTGCMLINIVLTVVDKFGERTVTKNLSGTGRHENNLIVL